MQVIYPIIFKQNTMNKVIIIILEVLIDRGIPNKSIIKMGINKPNFLEIQNLIYFYKLSFKTLDNDIEFSI